MKTEACVVIIGGGIMGCSLAYHLCKEGEKDVLLIEKGELTSGSTWHAAGQITHSVSHYGLARMAAYGTELYPKLEAETGQSCTWHGCGSLRMAYEQAEIDWLQYTLSIGMGIGYEMEVIHTDRIRELHPFYNLDGIQVALHTPGDGHVDPAGVTFALAKGAQLMGAEIIRHNRVTGITLQPGREFLVHTEKGDVRAEKIVNAGGTYARQIGAWVGLDLPLVNMLHHYLVTDTVPAFLKLEHELPVVRDDRQVSGYIRMEQKSGLIGIYEKANPKSVWDHGTPWEAEHELFDPDYERIMPWLENAMQRMPILADLGIKRVVHGAISHPPDGNMLLGPSGLPNFWLCCGSQVGIAWGPGAGRYLAQWMIYGSADISLRSFDPLRFGARMDREYHQRKAYEDYLLRHEIPFPDQNRPECRPSHSKVSPLYEVLRTQGAVYEDVYGWERPRWYATEGMDCQHIHSFRRSELWDIIGREVHGLRAHAGIADLTAFAKVEVDGTDAEHFLQRISSNHIPETPGRIVLTYFIQQNGRIEGEATLARLDAEQFYLVYAAVREAALLHWMQTQVRPGEEVIFHNVSSQVGVILLAGPASRRLLADTTDDPLDNTAFPWLSTRKITVAGIQNIRAMRVTYTGELGWELHIPIADMPSVYHALTATPNSAALVHIGSAALNAMRMEKAYRSGHEITPEITLAEAAVTRFARQPGFQGAACSLAPPTRWKLALLQLDEPVAGTILADPLGSESVWKDHRFVGRISSGGYGYAIGAWLGFAYLTPTVCEPGTELTVLVQGRHHRAQIIPGAVYDPDNQRPRAEA